MSSGISQITYIARNDSISDFIKHAQRSGLLDADAQAKEEEFLVVLRSSKDRFHPCLSFWCSKYRESNRKVDLHFIKGQEEDVRKIDAIGRLYDWSSEDRIP
jgi:hypothetical protein